MIRSTASSIRNTSVACALSAFLILCAAPLAALTVTDSDRRVPLGTHSSFLEDPSGALTIDQVSAPGTAARFRPILADTFNRATMKGTFWFKIPLEWKTAASDRRGISWVLEISYPSLETITLFLPAGSPGRWIVKEAGEHLPYAGREIEHRNPAFHLPLPPNALYTIFVRVTVEKVMLFPPVLWQREAFARSSYTEQLVHGMYFGILLVMVLYNLFLFASLRDRSYLYYVLYTVCFGLFQFSFTGLAYEYLWPGAPDWNTMANVVFVFLTFILAVQFSRHYLLIDRHSPVLSKIMIGLMGVGALCVALTFFVDRTLMTHISNILPACGIIVFIAAGVSALRRKSRAARYFLFAWGAYIVGVALFVMKNLGALPANAITLYGIQAGSAIEIVLFSLGLADRINELRREREQSKQQLVGIQHEMDIARRIQLSLLPASVPQPRGASLTVRYTPATEIGGDYYDFNCDQSASCGVLIADVSGHGIPAAIISSVLKISFHEQLRARREPAALLSGMNDMLIGKIGSMYITAGYLVLDLTARRARYANAGHQPLCVVNRATGEIRDYLPKGIILGWQRHDGFEECDIPIAPDDRLIFSTDGYVESRNGAGELFGTARLHHSLRRNRALPAEALIDTIGAEVDAWSMDRKGQEDDRTMLVIDID